MADNYVVNYDINVNASKGLDAIRQFQEATLKLGECGRKLNEFSKKVESVHAKFRQLSKKAPVFDIATSKANKKLDSVIVKLEKIHSLAKKTVVLPVGAVHSKGDNSVKGGGRNKGGKGGSSNGRPPTPRSLRNLIPKNIGYRNLGPTMIDSGGIGAFDMIKGMGMAYGLTGLGTLMGSALRDATEYDNLMKTTENILKTHDRRPGFNRRFQEMAQEIRHVGVETKFTAPEVADASKFLAMAGFSLDAISQSIRAISDIALVGDTDLGTTADVVTNIMTGYGISSEKMDRAADVMAMTFTKTNTTLMEIAEAYKYSASLLAAGGIPFEVSTAGIGILGDAGIKGSQAGTTMRTILANLVNPTNKQAAQWEAIGVERLDKAGHLRPLVSIFQDLDRKNLEVADFYKIFHKTAAQGAVSLAKNVEKWNDVIYHNFLSNGLAHRLAQEKKNTIEGLWAQLTSMFTENGIETFEELQQPIKDMLNQMISWLKTPEALNTVKELSASLFDLIQMLKDFSVWIIKAYSYLKWFVQLWLKFQVIMWPVLSILRSFRALFNLLGGGISIFYRFTHVLRNLKDIVIQIKTLGLLNIIGGFFTNSSAQGASKGGAVLKKAVLGSKEQVATGGMFLSTGPWVAAAVAVGALAYGIYDTYRYLKDLREAYGDWYEDVYATKGYLSKGLSPTERYLKLVYDKQVGVNTKVEEYIRLRRTELGLASDAVKERAGKNIGDLYRDQLDKIDDSPWYSFLLGDSTTASAWENGQEVLKRLPEQIRSAYGFEDWTDTEGRYHASILKNGKTYRAEHFTRDMFASTIGYDSPEGKEIIEEFTTAFKQAPLEEWEAIRNRLNLRLLEYGQKVNESYANLSLDEIGKLSSSEILSIPLAYKTFVYRILEAFDLNNGDENAQSLAALHNVMSRKGKLSLADQAQFFAANGVGSLLIKEDGTQPFSEEWLQQQGFDSQQNKFVDYGSHTAQYWAEQFYKVTLGGIIDVMNQLNPDVQKEFTLQHTPVALAAWQQSQIQYKAPDTDGTLYTEGGATGADQSRYKSHYQTGSAAPKQIIVKISNLMNVESVDLSNPNNAMAVENLKEQLTQALVDVVHDFDVSFHD